LQDRPAGLTIFLLSSGEFNGESGFAGIASVNCHIDKSNKSVAFQFLVARREIANADGY